MMASLLLKICKSYMKDILIDHLNLLHFWVAVIGIILVIIISICAICKKLENEKFWIAIIAFIAFSMYCLIDYDIDNKKFRHPAPSVPCHYEPPPNVTPDNLKGSGDR